jgi:ATP-dependent DNA helicase RecG
VNSASKPNVPWLARYRAISVGSPGTPITVRYTTNSKLETRIDQSGQRGYATGCQGLVTFVMQQMPQNEIIENALRKKVKLLPENSVRELIANSLTHQDLKIGGAGPMIEIYPGEPVVKADRLIDGYQSRSERLADFMRRMNICEERGSGIDRVVHEAEAFQLLAPKFQSNPQRATVTVYGLQPLEDMDREDRIRACYQHCSLKWVLNERMTNQSLRNRFGYGNCRLQLDQIRATRAVARSRSTNDQPSARQGASLLLPICYPGLESFSHTY